MRLDVSIICASLRSVVFAKSSAACVVHQFPGVVEVVDVDRHAVEDGDAVRHLQLQVRRVGYVDDEAEAARG